MRPIHWMGTSRADLRDMPKAVRFEIGLMLDMLQNREPLGPPRVKPLTGLGSGVVEIRDDFDGDTFRAVVLLRFEASLYVLHVFRKKSLSGRAHPRPDRNLIEERLRRAIADHARRNP